MVALLLAVIEYATAVIFRSWLYFPFALVAGCLLFSCYWVFLKKFRARTLPRRTSSTPPSREDEYIPDDNEDAEATRANTIQAVANEHSSVFISYAKQDEAIAGFVQNVLNRAGYRASTFAASVPAGDRWISSINLSLETADVVVALISKAALESNWVLYEVSASIASVEKSSRKRIIPVALSKDLVPSGVLSQYQWVTTSGEPQEVADAVIRALNEPPIADKALERAEALLNLERVQKYLNIEEERWNGQIGRRNALATRHLILLLSFIILAAAILIVVIYKPSSGVTAVIVGVLAAFSTSLAFISGRISTRDERGTSGGRPRN